MGKRGLLILFFLLIFLLSSFNAHSMANPSAVYCEELNNEFGGYEYKIVKDSLGNEQGICIPPDKKEYNGWDFFKGKVGKEYSYCAKKGYDIKTVNGEAICVPKSKVRLKKLAIAGENSNKEEISMAELMGLNEKLSATAPKMKQEPDNNQKTGRLSSSSLEEVIPLNSEKNQLSSTYSSTDYSYWDWRNPPNGTIYASNNFDFFDENNGWMTSIKDQSSCGSCWAFSVMGSLEPKYELNKNNSRLNPDLSEQHEVSCDTSCWPSPYYCQQKCKGGWMDLAMEYIKTDGVVDDGCFPYTNNNNTCESRCSDYSQRLWNITNYTTTWRGGITIIPLNNEQTMQYLIDYGPMTAAMGINSDYGGNFSNNIYRCTDDSGANHGVVLIGYNYTGNESSSYWIIKNSWGIGFGEDGYFKLGFNECNFTSEFEFAHDVTPPNFKPSITLNSPSTNYSSNNNQTTFNLTISTRISSSATCDLYINGAIVNSTTALNNTATLIPYNLSDGTYLWNISCWENGIGIVNYSQSRILNIDATPPIITIADSVTNYTSAIINISSNEYINLTIMYWKNDSLVNISNNSTFSNFFQIRLDSLSALTTYFYNVTICDWINNCNALGVYNFTTSQNPALIPPNVTLISPIDLLNSSNNSRIFTCIVWDNFNITNVTFYLNSSEWHANETNVSGLNNSNYSFAKNISDGVYIWNCFACDNDSNCAFSSQNNTLTIDSTPPIANAGANITANVTNTIIFNASNSTDNVLILSYHWNFGDGYTSSSQIANHSYSAIGNYTVNLTVTDWIGNSNSTSIIAAIEKATVSNVYVNETTQNVSFENTPVANVLMKIEGIVSNVTAAEVYGTTAPNTTGEVPSTTLATTVSYFTINLTNRSWAGSANITFKVSNSTLVNNSLSASDIVLYVYENTTGSWTWAALATYGVDNTTDPLIFKATTTHFSTFAAGKEYIAPVTTPTTTSSSGGGGGGSGIVNNPTTLSNSFLSVKANKEYSLKGKRAALAVTEIKFYVKKSILKIQLTVNTTNIPENIISQENVFQYFQITPEIGLKKEDVSRAEIYFRVNNSWFKLNHLYESKVSLLRYNNRWEKYPAALVEKDSTYSYFSASVPGFSYFAITGEKIGIKQNITAEKVTKNETVENKTIEEVKEPIEDKKGYNINILGIIKNIFIIGIALLLVIAIASVLKKKMKEEKELKRIVREEMAKPTRHTHSKKIKHQK